jgi:hypothetical protein
LSIGQRLSVLVKEGHDDCEQVDDHPAAQVVPGQRGTIAHPARVTIGGLDLLHEVELEHKVAEEDHGDGLVDQEEGLEH